MTYTLFCLAKSMTIFLALISVVLCVIIFETIIDWLVVPSTLGIEHTNYYSQYPVYQSPATGIRKWMVELLDFGDDMSIVVQ
ncbi:hypothetical protein K492DRAFT_172322 [Lichtheimia hyalospora FSU 10163]|nr:hypothetical protein K492DRAFT_172322 [Lichtheimia hyalospora FSU 10163]